MRSDIPTRMLSLGPPAGREPRSASGGSPKKERSASTFAASDGMLSESSSPEDPRGKLSHGIT